MARRNRTSISQLPQRSAPRRVARTIRTSNNYLKKFLLAVFIFLLGAVTAYRFLQRLPVDSLNSDLLPTQITLDPSAQPSIQPEGTLFTTPVPNSLPIVTAKPAIANSPTPKVSASPVATPKPLPTVKPSPTSSVKSNPSVIPTTIATPIPTPTVAPKPSAQPSANPTAQNAEVGKTYIVQKGDSLWKISQAAYGDPYQWSKIYAQNKKVIGANPGILYAGMQLALPSVK